MATALRLAGTGGLSAGSLASVFPDPTGKAKFALSPTGACGCGLVWPSPVLPSSVQAGRSLAGCCAMLGRVDGLGFPGA